MSLSVYYASEGEADGPNFATTEHYYSLLDYSGYD